MVGELYLRNGLPITGPVQRVGAQNTAQAPDRTMTERWNKDWDNVPVNWEPELSTDSLTDSDEYSTFTGPDGDTWARVKFAAGKSGTDSGHKKQLVVYADATGWQKAYFQYNIRFGDGFGYVKGGKLAGLMAGSGSGGSGGMDANTGLNVARWRNMWRGTGGGTDDELMVYCYDRERFDVAGIGGFGENWNPTRIIRPGKFHRFEQEITLNTAGGDNGTLRMWVDGVMMAEQLDRKLLESGSTIGIRGFQFDLFWGGNDSSWDTERLETIELGRVVFEAE